MRNYKLKIYQNKNYENVDFPTTSDFNLTETLDNLTETLDSIDLQLSESECFLF